MTRKLGYLVPQFPGQTHIFFWREIVELEARGIELHLFSTRPPPPGLIAHDWSDAAMARTTYLGRADPIAALAAMPRLPWRAMLRSIRAEGVAHARDIALAIPAARHLRQQARARGISHVHVHSCGRTALIAALAKAMGGPEYSLTLHGPLADYGPGQRFKWQGARFASIITEKLLAEMRAEMPEALPPRLPIQPMGVDTEALHPRGPYQPASPQEPLKLFSCGRLNVIKGHRDLMAAVRILLDQGRDVQLKIAGEDDAGGTGYRQELEAQIEALDLSAHVQLLGAIDAAQVRDHLHETHIFVLASLNEALGVALMEAMSCAIPTIGTATGGVGELIRDGIDGVLVPPQSPATLAEAIAALADDPDRARMLAAAGRTRVLERFHSGRGAEMLISEIWGD